MENVVAIVILVAIIAGAIFVYRKDPKIICKVQAFFKYQNLKQDIKNIENLHYRTVGDGKNVGFLEKGKLKKNLNESKGRYESYVQFMESNGLELPPQIEPLRIKIEETEDVLDPKAALDRALDRANQEYDRVYAMVNESGEELYGAREEAAKAVDLVEALVNSIARHPKIYDKELKVIRIERKKFKDAVDFGLEQKKALENSAKGIGAGVAAGTAVASMAPTAAMWVATTFGTASTGTAISALSGAAATNAALAWLGGGALAAGGGGMAAGHALLALAGPVGWGIAGTSALASVLLVVRKRFKLQEDKKKHIEQIKNCTEALKEMKAQMEVLTIQTKSLTCNLGKQFSQCEMLEGMNFKAIPDEQAELLGALVNNTKSLSVLLSKTLDS